MIGEQVTKLTRLYRIAKSDKHLVASNFDFVRQSGFGRRHAHGLTVSNIEFGSMPWTNQTVAIHLAVP